VARLGGDEFTLLLPELTHAEDAALVAQKILEAVRYPFHIEGREFYITTSIGISVFPEDGPDAETFARASAADVSKPQRVADTMAFMFETRAVIHPTRFALESAQRQPEYYRCWATLASHFDPDKP
jgi:predicted signal transduction protein with EAL and GGDEF domain